MIINVGKTEGTESTVNKVKFVPWGTNDPAAYLRELKNQQAVEKLTEFKHDVDVINAFMGGMSVAIKGNMPDSASNAERQAAVNAKTAGILALMVPVDAAFILTATSIAARAAVLLDAMLPANAAGILAAMVPEHTAKAAEILADSNMTSAKAAAIMATKEDNGTVIISDAKATEILAAMAGAIVGEAEKAAAILAAKNENGTAIISDAKAAEILVAMDANSRVRVTNWLVPQSTPSSVTFSSNEFSVQSVHAIAQKRDADGNLTSTYVLNNDYSIERDEIFMVPPDITLETSYTITIQSGGELRNNGTITNTVYLYNNGEITNNGTITNQSGGTIKNNNSGKITNESDSIITNAGEITNDGWIFNVGKTEGTEPTNNKVNFVPWKNDPAAYLLGLEIQQVAKILTEFKDSGDALDIFVASYGEAIKGSMTDITDKAELQAAVYSKTADILAEMVPVDAAFILTATSIAARAAAILAAMAVNDEGRKKAAGILAAKNENDTAIISDAKAAAILVAMVPAKAAAAILATMVPAKAAAILAANENGTAIISDAKATNILDEMVIGNQGDWFVRLLNILGAYENGTAIISYARAAKILAAMAPFYAAEILTSDGLDRSNIVAAMDTAKAANIIANGDHVENSV